MTNRSKLAGFVLNTLLFSLPFTLTLQPAFADTPSQADAAHAFEAFADRESAWLEQLSAHDLESISGHRDAKGHFYKFTSESTEGDPQTQPPWALKDFKKDKIHGTSTDRAYADLNLRAPAKPVVVAVIDSGVDIKHPDLEKIHCTSPNGKLHGWNFLGAPDGRNITATTLESTRLLSQLLKKKKLSPKETALKATLQKEFNDKVATVSAELDNQKRALNALQSAIDILKSEGLTEFSLKAIQAFAPTAEEGIKAQKLASVFLKRAAGSVSERQSAMAEKQAELDYNFSLSFDSSTIVGDRPTVMNEKGYGNSDVTTSTALHGTHVSGIIGALRNNGIGMDGQSDYVQIMPIRAVPDGDERDKDVGNAIRFAVDNGARIVNMSFGKPYSPNKDYVDQAVQYAANHGVLLVHAAGNDAKDVDLEDNFPSPHALRSTRHFENWLEVGASDQNGKSAVFSNFGKISVDLFAPGVAIYSTLPDGQYGELQGTSMASPEVAGVAALVLSQYPNLSAKDLREVLMEAGSEYAPLPGLSAKSSTGRIVNAYEALQNAAKRR